MGLRSCRRNSLSLVGLVWVFAMLALKPEPISMAYLDKSLEMIEEEEKQYQTNCAYSRRVKRHDQSMFPPTRPTGARFGKAVRFFGKEVIKFTGPRVVTSREFTINFWMKPEGGQQSPVTVLGLFDYCSMQTPDRGWRIGLKESATEKNLRVFFNLRAARSHNSSTILSPLKVEPNVWIHVAATYDGRKMKLYINQANVAVSSDQKGHVFAKALMPDQCEALEAGGDINSKMYFRGILDDIKLWSVAKSHQSISLGVFNDKKMDFSGLILYEDFNGVSGGIQFQTSWIAVTKSLPETVKSTIPSDAHDLTITKPPCGTTVCDNPEVVRSYVNNTHLRDNKVLRFRIINVMENDGRNPIVSREQIRYQTEILNNSFQRYNISWELHEVNVRNTSLRLRTVLYLCSPSKIGDMECNEDCDLPITGQDGGDCIKGGVSKCDPSKRGNGKCDLECNRHDHLWDYGDCCNPELTQTHKTCFDPTSPYRAYISVQEYKTLLHFKNHQFLNVYFAQCGDQCTGLFHGAATFPWEKTVHSTLGGVIINPSHFGHKKHSNAIIHEFGHMLGLWHVHHGVSELKCTDECHEHFPSMELGDLCSDTNPTPRNEKCRDPSPKKTKGNCRAKEFKNTPFTNYMSYSNDACTDSFTPQQVARMHCYIDLVYQSWQSEKTRPSFIPLPPRVTGEFPSGTVAIAWIPPLGTGGENAKNMCHNCRENSVLHQYAVTAFSPISEKPNGLWGPNQAIGAPDTGPCELSPKAWSPLLNHPIPSCNNCYIELGFSEAVVPTTLSIWVSWHSNNGISDIQLWFDDSSYLSLGNATAQCDAPLTMGIKTTKRVSKVRVYVRDPYTCIDAVQLTSSVLHPNCLRCKPLEYHVTRDPAFAEATPVVVNQTRFIDETVERGITYKYSIQAVTSSGLKGSPSPVLTYTPERGFCGDGHVDRENGEECDDGNVRDGDGCNVRCKKEDVFHCQGHPSLCYRHDGDGVCEEFERITSIKDCGFYTPDGFEDQWTRNATANPKYQEVECPETVVIGPPSRDLVCKPEWDMQTSWAPCGHSLSDADYWLDVMFERAVVPAAVVLYIGSDGQTKYSDHVLTVEAELVDTSGGRHPSGSKSVNLSCKTNPVIIPVRHDMTKRFFYCQQVRIKFRSFMIGIAGVALRSPTNVDPVAMATCKPGELFNPRTQKCHKYECVKPSCEPLVIKRTTVKCEGNEEGQRCTVTCAKGYLPRGSFKLLCLRRKWRGAVKKCIPMNCGMPKIPNAKPDCPKGTHFGTTCTFRCIQHAKMNGKDNSITCEDDSKWSVQRSFCVRTCAPPSIPLNAVAVSNNACVNGKVKRFYPGMACKFRCKIGYKLVKDKYAPSKKTIKLRCTKEGKWTLNSRCVPITCQLPPPYLLSWYNCSNGNVPGSICTSLCPKEKSHQVKCGLEGRWSPKFMKCKAAKSCGKVQAPGITFVCDDYGLEGTCKAKCFKPEHDAVIKGKEDKLNVIIKCNDKHRWVPDPRMFVCLPKCRKDVGDGFCDGPNNNKHCGWDGGDCCLSTSKRHLVIPTPTCLEACDCKDPRALENTKKTPSPGSGAGLGPNNGHDDDEDDNESGGENESKLETKQ